MSHSAGIQCKSFVKVVSSFFLCSALSGNAFLPLVLVYKSLAKSLAPRLGSFAQTDKTLMKHLGNEKASEKNKVPLIKNEMLLFLFQTWWQNEIPALRGPSEIFGKTDIMFFFIWAACFLIQSTCYKKTRSIQSIKHGFSDRHIYTHAHTLPVITTLNLIEKYKS